MTAATAAFGQVGIARTAAVLRAELSRIGRALESTTLRSVEMAVVEEHLRLVLDHLGRLAVDGGRRIELEVLSAAVRDRDRDQLDRAADLRRIVELLLGQGDLTAVEPAMTIPAADEIRLLAMLLAAADEAERVAILTPLSGEMTLIWREFAAPALCRVHEVLAGTASRRSRWR